MFSKRASGIGSGLAFVLGLAMIIGAAPAGAAPYLSVGTNLQGGTRASSPAQKSSRYRIPRAVFFNEVAGRGLLVKVWVNGIGPYTFALDTGAGASIVSSRVAAEAGLPVKRGSQNRIAGLSGIPHRELTTEVRVASLAIGDRDNTLPATGIVLKADIFPNDIDGILDPTEAFWPLGYAIDFPSPT